MVNVFGIGRGRANYTGWSVDPTREFEFRYYVCGQPTGRVCQQHVDPNFAAGERRLVIEGMGQFLTVRGGEIVVRGGGDASVRFQAPLSRCAMPDLREDQNANSPILHLSFRLDMGAEINDQSRIHLYFPLDCEEELRWVIARMSGRVVTAPEPSPGLTPTANKPRYTYPTPSAAEEGSGRSPDDVSTENEPLTGRRGNVALQETVTALREQSTSDEPEPSGGQSAVHTAPPSAVRPAPVAEVPPPTPPPSVSRRSDERWPLRPITAPRAPVTWVSFEPLPTIVDVVTRVEQRDEGTHPSNRQWNEKLDEHGDRRLEM